MFYHCHVSPFYTMRIQTEGHVVNSQWGDVNGDGIADYVYLTGTASADSPYTQNIQLHVRDGRTNQTFSIPLKENTGYNPTIFLGDFTGNGVNEILINIDSGGSGAFTYDSMYSFLNNRAQLLYDNDWFVESYSKDTDVIYEDGYKVRILNRSLNKQYVLDISERGRDYLSQMYDEQGKLTKPTRGSVLGVSGAYPIDLQRDGIYELFPFQRVIGLYNADALGYLQTPLSWDKEQLRFVPMYQLAAIFGNEITD